MTTQKTKTPTRASLRQKKINPKPLAAARTVVNNEVRLDAKNPIPIDGNTRAFSFVGEAAYLPFLAPKDDFGKQMLEARILSVTHNRCIVSKAKYCTGAGFAATDGKDLDQDFSTWLMSMNMKNEPARKLIKRLFEDYFTWGNVPVELVRFKVGKQPYFCVYVHNFLEWRLGTPDDDDICQYAIQSKLFLRNSGYVSAAQIKKSKVLPLYNPLKSDKENWFKDTDGVERTLIWYKNSFSGFPYYGLASAIAALIDEVLEYKGARYNLDNFDNNMVLSAILALKGNLSQPEADRIGKKAIQTHTGDGKRGRVMVVASEEGIDGSELHTLETSKDGSFIEADNKWMQKIFMANEWDPMLTGILSDSTLGKGAGFFTKILETANNNVILPEQQDCYAEVWYHIFSLAAKWMGWKIDPATISIRNNVNISGLTDVDITPAVKVNEVREAKGLPADNTEKGEMYLGELKGRQNNQKGGNNVQD